MSSKRVLYRARERLIAGVCAGIAEFTNVDAVVVRILAVVVTITTLGVAGLLYLVLWAVMPKAHQEVVPLEIRPESLHSDTYGPVDLPATVKDHVSQEVKARYLGSSFAHTAHIPPDPPAAAPPRLAPVHPLPDMVTKQSSTTTPLGVKLGLVAGLLVVFAGFEVVTALLIPSIAWWHYWPLLLIMAGIVRMVIPKPNVAHAPAFSQGLACFSVGVTFLCMSIGFIDWASLGLMLKALWPLLIFIIILIILGIALDSSTCLLLAGVGCMLFCLIGVTFFSVPGPRSEIVLHAPYGRTYFFAALWTLLM